MGGVMTTIRFFMALTGLFCLALPTTLSPYPLSYELHTAPAPFFSSVFYPGDKQPRTLASLEAIVQEIINQPSHDTTQKIKEKKVTYKKEES